MCGIKERFALTAFFLYNEDMKRSIFTKEGYLDFNQIMQNRMTYNFIVGGRGIGKTFGALLWAIQNHAKFIFMRRTQVQVDMIKSEEMNPFNALTSVLGHKYTFCMKKINKNITGVYNGELDPDTGVYEPSGELLGYILALSTVSNIRGFDASDIDLLIYDEFIGEKHEKVIRSEGTAFLNAIETIARNRELQGRKPLKVVCLSNSNDLANPVFIELKLVSMVEKMLKKEQTALILPERELAIYLINKSPISEKKRQTSLYKLVGQSSFTDMALGNDFTEDNMALIRSLNLSEYKPYVQVGELFIYQHKSNKRKYYVSSHRSGKPAEVYDSTETELKRFNNSHYFFKLAYLNRNILFENYILQVLFERYINM